MQNDTINTSHNHMGSFEEAARHNMDNAVCWLMDADLAKDIHRVNWEIAISYYTISFALIALLLFFYRILSWRMKTYAGLFAAFILACGTGHIIKVQNIWWGDFLLEYRIDLLTARLSEITAIYAFGGVFYLIYKSYNKKEFLSKLTDVLILTGIARLSAKMKPEKFIDKKNINLIEFSELANYNVGEWISIDADKIKFQIQEINDDIIVSRCIMQEGGKFSPHNHDCWELVKLVRGEIECPMKGRKIFNKRGDIIIFGLNEVHSPFANKPTEMIVFFSMKSFDQDLINFVNHYKLPNKLY